MSEHMVRHIAGIPSGCITSNLGELCDAINDAPGIATLPEAVGCNSGDAFGPMNHTLGTVFVLSFPVVDTLTRISAHSVSFAALMSAGVFFSTPAYIEPRRKGTFSVPTSDLTCTLDICFGCIFDPFCSRETAPRRTNCKVTCFIVNIFILRSSRWDNGFRRNPPCTDVPRRMFLR